MSTSPFTQKRADKCMNVDVVELTRIADIHDSPFKYRVSLHAKIDMLSPVQVRGSTRYFDGWLADESARIRFVCFVPSKHAIFEEFARRGEAVSFSDVTIQKNKIGNAMEVLIQKSTPVLRSPQKIGVQTHLDAQPRVPREIVLADIVRQVPMQLVDVKAKVGDIAEISKGANNSTSVRKVGIANETDAVIITLWGDDAEHVLAGKSYNFRLSVKFDMGEYTLYTPRQGRPMIPIEPLQNFVPHEFSLGKNETLINAQIIGLSKFSSYFVCRVCKLGKAAPVENNRSCSSCGALSKTVSSEHQLSALLTVQTSLVQEIQLIADAAALAKICKKKLDDVDEFAIGAAPPFNVTYNRGRHILHVSRKTSSTHYPEFASAATNESSAPAAAATAKRSLCFEDSQELSDAASTATSDSDADVPSNEITSVQNSPKRSKSGN